MRNILALPFVVLGLACCVIAAVLQDGPQALRFAWKSLRA